MSVDSLKQMARRSTELLESEVVSTGEPKAESGARILSGGVEAKPAPPLPLRTHDESDCCGEKLDKDLRKGFNADEWTCPDCGELWQAVMVGDVKHYQMRPAWFVGRGRVRRG